MRTACRTLHLCADLSPLFTVSPASLTTMPQLPTPSNPMSPPLQNCRLPESFLPRPPLCRSSSGMPDGICSGREVHLPKSQTVHSAHLVFGGTLLLDAAFALRSPNYGHHELACHGLRRHHIISCHWLQLPFGLEASITCVRRCIVDVAWIIGLH